MPVVIEHDNVIIPDFGIGGIEVDDIDRAAGQCAVGQPMRSILP